MLQKYAYLLFQSVSRSQAKRLADDVGCQYMECSAETGQNVDEAFNLLIHSILIKKGIISTEPIIKNPTENTPSLAQLKVSTEVKQVKKDNGGFLSRLFGIASKPTLPNIQSTSNVPLPLESPKISSISDPSSNISESSSKSAEYSSRSESPIVSKPATSPSPNISESFKRFVIQRKDIALHNIVGEGAQGIVRKAEWKGIPVVYKQVKLAKGNERKEFMNEFEVWR